MSVIEFSGSRRKRHEDSSGFLIEDTSLIEYGSDDTEADRTPAPVASRHGWTNQERADLARAEHLILAARPDLEFVLGATDEGEPWCVVCNETGDVLIHICRIDGEYRLDNAALPTVLSGPDLRALIDAVQETRASEEGAAPSGTITPLRRTRKMYFHPSVMITALFWTLILESSSDEIFGNTVEQDARDDFASLDAIGATPSAESVPSEVRDADVNVAPVVHGPIAVDRAEKASVSSVNAASHALTTLAIAAGFMSATSFDAANALRFGIDPADLLARAFSSAYGHSADEAEIDDAWSLSDVAAFWDALFAADVVIAESDGDASSQQPSDAGLDYLVSQTGILNLLTDPTLELPTINAFMAWLEEVSTQRLVDSVRKLAGDVRLEDLAAFEADRAISTEVTANPDASLLNMLAFEDLSKLLVDQDKAVVLHSDVSFAQALSGYDQSLADMLLNPRFGMVTTLQDAGSSLNSDGVDSSVAIEVSAPSVVDNSTQGSTGYREFSDEARAFLDERMAAVDVEVLIYKNEIVFIDETAFSGDNVSSTVSWVMFDGGVVSFVGVADDINAYLNSMA